MALSFAHGAIQWLGTDALNTVYTVSGLSFQPKAIRFYFVGGQSATDFISGSVHERRGVGFSDGTTHRCVTTYDEDAALTSVCASAALSDCIAAQITTATIVGKLGTCTITSDGFTVRVDLKSSISMTVFWEAWGGNDIIAVTVGDIAEPAATGDQNYTATGFAGGTGKAATHCCVMTAGVQSTAAVGSSQAEASGLTIGFFGGGSGGIGHDVMVTGNADHNSTTADTDGYCIEGKILGQVALAGGNLTSDANFKATGTNLFTLTWNSVTTTNRRSIYMAIAGGQWYSLGTSIAGNSLNATVTISGLAFQPQGVCFIGRMTAAQTGTTTSVQDRIGMGTATGTTTRRTMGIMSEDNSTSGSSVMEISMTIQYDQCLAYAGPADTLITCYDISQWNSDGFQIINDLAGGVASEWIGYLTFGSDEPNVGAVSVNFTATGVGAADGIGSGSATMNMTAAGAPVTSGGGAASVNMTATAGGAADGIGSGSALMNMSAAGGGAFDAAQLGYYSLTAFWSGGAGTVAGKGTGTSTFEFSATGAGAADFTGTGASSVEFSATGTGKADFTGTGASLVEFAATAVGAPAITGAGAATVEFSATGIGAPVATGAGASAIEFTATAVGAPVATGTGTSLVEFSATAGSAAEKIATGSASVEFSATAVPTGGDTGSGTALVNFTATGVGAPAVTGTGASSFEFTTTGTGAPAFTGSGASSFEIGVSATSKVDFTAHGTSTFEFAASGVPPSTTDTGTGTATFSFVVTGTFLVDAIGSGTALFNFNAVGGGVRGTQRQREGGGGKEVHRPGPYYREAKPKPKKARAKPDRINDGAWAALGMEELMGT